MAPNEASSAAICECVDNENGYCSKMSTTGNGFQPHFRVVGGNVDRAIGSIAGAGSHDDEHSILMPEMH
ncbi:hypothetical protein TYRP_023306 [Tyrophagus putrescentiae]|nr:hypothetical protein TYRP_023306 [Tyrophagus putrescentiae]